MCRKTYLELTSHAFLGWKTQEIRDDGFRFRAGALVLDGTLGSTSGGWSPPPSAGAEVVGRGLRRSASARRGELTPETMRAVREALEEALKKIEAAITGR